MVSNPFGPQTVLVPSGILLVPINGELAPTIWFINGAFVIRRGAWDALPEIVQKSMLKLADDRRVKNQLDIRKADERAYIKLVERGHKPVTLQLEEWRKLGVTLRSKMIGRIYTQELVDKAQKIASQYPD